MKICFITSIFGKSYKEIDKPSKFKKIKNYDYYLFTNLDPSDFNTSWDVVNIEDHLDKSITSSIIKSRYPKFMGWKLVKDLFDKEYDVIFYCDGIYIPKHYVNWKKYSKKILNHKSGILLHHEYDSKNIFHECDRIVKSKRDTKEKIIKTKEVLKNYKNAKVFRNGNFGYNPNNKNLTDIFQEFWNIYYPYDITHRDQPIFSYLLEKNKLVPLNLGRFRISEKLFKKTGKKGFNKHRHV